MARPFLILVLPLAVGILAGGSLPLSPAAAAALLLISLVCAWVIYFLSGRAAVSAALVGAAMFFLGAGTLALNNRRYESNPLARLQESGYLDFFGRLVRSPERGSEFDRLFLNIEAVTTEGRRTPVPGRLRVTVPHSTGTDSVRSLLVGDRIKISARLSQPAEYRNFQPPGYQRYLKSLGIHRTASTKSALLVEKLESGRTLSLGRVISRLRRRIQGMIELHFSSKSPFGLTPEGGILESLLLGARERLNEDLARSFRESGLFHLFAISGAHIAILTFLIFTLLKAVRIGRTPSFLVLIGFLALYAALVEGRPSVMRAAVMTGAYLIGKWLWKDVDLLNTLSISAFFLLLANPLHLFSAGFQLTYAATLAIILFFPRLIRFFPRLPLRLSEIFVVTLCAQLGVLPIMAATFNRIAFAGLLLNFAALPLVAVIMSGGYFFLFLALIGSGPAALAARGIELAIGLLIKVSALTSALPGLSSRVPTPPALLLAAYPVLLLALLIPKKIVFRAIGTALFTLAALILIYFPFPVETRDLTVTFLDVGQGDSILIEFPGRHKMLVDGGGSLFGDFDVGEQVVSRFLWRKGIRRLDTLVLTHAHPDHMDGLNAVARNFRIGEFWESDRPQENAAYAQFTLDLPNNLVRRRLFRGDSIKVGDARVRVCHPERSSHPPAGPENDRSMVLRLESAGLTILLTGDVEAGAERSMLASGEDLEGLILKSPHHGSRSSSTIPFLDAVSPKLVVISVGRGNRYGLPDEDVLERCRAGGAVVYRTDLHGAIEISRRQNRLFVRTAAGPGTTEFPLMPPPAAAGPVRESN